MTIIATLPRSLYPAGQTTLNFTTTVEATEFSLTISIDGWPVGALVTMEISWGGVFATSLSCGPASLRLNRQGNPITTTTLRVRKPVGIVAGSATITLSNPVTASATVERLP